MKLSELLERYCEVNILSAQSANTYLYVVRSFILYYASDPEIEDINLDTVLAYRKWTLARNAAITFNSKRRHLIAIFNFACNHKLLARNVFKDVKPAPMEQLPSKAIPSAVFDTYVQMLANGRDVDGRGGSREMFHPQWFWLTVVKTLFLTGMRKRQLVGLEWRDVDFSEMSITLRAQTSKTRREWKVPIPEELLSYLEELSRRTIEIRGPNLGIHQVFCLPLFSKRSANFVKRVMTPANVNAFFLRFCKRLPPGSAKLSAHRIRHTTATMLAKTVSNLKVVQVQLGHTSFSTTLLYVHPDLEEQRQAIRGLTALTRTV